MGRRSRAQTDKGPDGFGWRATQTWLRHSAFSMIALGLAVLGLAGPPAVADEIEIRAVNGTYRDLDSNLAPIEQGGLTIRITSPEHELTVHHNRLALEPRAGGSLGASMEVEFEGAGHLVAVVEGAGGSQSFADAVEAPRQTLRLAGEIRLERVEDGFLFTLEETDRFATLEIKSAMGRQIVALCRAFEILPFVALTCDGLDRALSTVVVPLPGPGEKFLLPAADLTDDEKAFFNRFAAGE